MSEDRKDDAAKPPGNKPPRLNIKITDEAAKGVYANLAALHSNEHEVIFDFIFAEPQRPQGQLVSRVVANPRTVKRLHQGLTELLKMYEQRFGEIRVPEGQSPQGSYH